MRTIKLITLSIFCLGLCISCNNEGIDSDLNSEVQEVVISVEEIQIADEGALISEEITGIIENIITNEEVATTQAVPFSAANANFLPDCVTISTVVSENSVERTIAFEGSCELPNGNILSGTIKMSHERDITLATRTINFSLENFVFNDVSVEGSSSIVRVRENENGNPQSTVTTNFDAIWPDDTSASFSGLRVRELIEGSGTPTLGDNVILITGNRSFTNRNNVTFQMEITQELRREFACRFIVSGILDITRGNRSASLDFGDGTCDNRGLLTNDEGETRVINLRRFR
ncbi:hypothetical protein GTQ40_01245 [Flavobacteriaceae bacterium R38]|nr:hypothetical protein [Flavobacteriaceae bacterium R38]